METPNLAASGQPRWNTPQAYAIAVVCLALGIVLGYVGRGSAASPQVPPERLAQHSPQQTPRMQMTPAQLKNIVTAQAEPLLGQLKVKPGDYDTLVKLAKTYYSAHQLDDAIKYMVLAVRAKPDDVDTRIHLGIAYFYTQRREEALAEFQRTLEYDAGNADALFNIGFIRWRTNHDGAGAIAAWKSLLRKHPDHPKRAEVERFIAEAQQQSEIK